MTPLYVTIGWACVATLLAIYFAGRWSVAESEYRQMQKIADKALDEHATTVCLNRYALGTSAKIIKELKAENAWLKESK